MNAYGRNTISPIQVDSKEALDIYLQTYCKKAKNRLTISSGFDGYLSTGHYYYIDDTTVSINYERTFFKSTWYFRGHLEHTESGTKLAGSFKLFPALEFLSIFVLTFVLFGASVFTYNWISVQPVTILDTVVMTAGFPTFLLVVRWIFSPIPIIGGNSIIKIQNLLNVLSKNPKHLAS